MRPAFALEIDGENKAGAYRERLSRLTLKDERGLLSDQLELEFDDADGRLAIPGRGHEISVALGWGESLTPMGSFFVDEVSISSRGTMRLTGKGFDTLQDLKSVSSRLYDVPHLAGLVEAVGKAHGLEVKASVELSKVKLATPIAQRNESVVHFLSRLADEHALSLKIQSGTILVLPQGAGKSVSGAPLPVIEIRAEGGRVRAWDFEFVSRPLFRSVEAEAFDIETAQSEKVTVGSGKPVFRFREVFPSRTKALRAAEAKLAKAAREAAIGSLELEGDPRICADSALSLVGFRAAIDGPWCVTAATHTLTPDQSYTVGLSCEMRLRD